MWSVSRCEDDHECIHVTALILIVANVADSVSLWGEKNPKTNKEMLINIFQFGQVVNSEILE